MIIEIGNKPLKELTAENIMEIAIIEGHVPHLEYWNKPELLNFDNEMFSNTIVIDYISTRKSDGIKSAEFTFFFDFEKLSMRNYKSQNKLPGLSNRAGLETLRYLIKEGFDVPIYDSQKLSFIKIYTKPII
jgi:hypothetical protein